MKIKFDGSIIKKRREQLGYTQRALALATKIEQANICRWEQSKNVPNIVSLAILAQFLGFELNDVLKIKK